MYSWPLSKHVSNGVYDEVRRHFAAGDNGEWLLDHHAIWQKQMTIQAGENPQFCYNPDKNEIAILDKDIFYRFNSGTGNLQKDQLHNHFSYASSNSNNLIYNPVAREYNCYTFDLEVGKDIYRFDTLANDWNKSYHAEFPPDYWQHNRFFSPLDSSLYLFCGYGHHRYKNEINRYDHKTQTWEKLSFKNDRIKPRYLSGMGQLDNQHLILFGGYGSETGNQSMSPKHFYDLYKINIRTLEARKLWEIENPQEEFVVSNTIIPDTNGKSFYALAFPLQQFYTKLSLLKFSIERPEYTVVADSIPFNFEDVKSNASLYLDKTTNRLIAVVVNSITKMTSELSVYTLSYPPLTTNELYQDTEECTSCWVWLGKIGILLLVGGGILWVILVRRKKRKRSLPSPEQHKPVINNDDTYISFPQPKTRSVCLFGGFQVYDKDGNDVTKEFTPTLKQLFVLLLLYTAKSGKGISSAKLKDTLWYDKSDESAKNNRGVFINKLRQVFENIGPIHIKNQDHYWGIELNDTIYCDYTRVISLMERLKREREEAKKSDIHLLLSIVSKGEFLPNMQTEWIDTFKSDFSNNLIDLLLLLYKYSAALRKEPSTCIHLADTIFIHDPLNEDALNIKCCNLVQMGKHGLARKVYTTFSKEYKSLFGADFEFSF
ncbi:hypothetical protein LJC35_07300 [Parabacteroides sp. OttesenSCG-928-N08]|nr:hypothetical protein [Parabacteroides sp. OttesenSCG-928-N08]